MSQPDLAKSLKNVSAKDRKQIEQAQEMLGPDPSAMGFIKNLFWGRIREELIFPMPVESTKNAPDVTNCSQSSMSISRRNIQQLKSTKHRTCPTG